MTLADTLDHLVLAGPDLPALVADFEERTGVHTTPGGRHPTGTANHLVALTIRGRRGPFYVELIGPDPARGAAELPATFGVDRLSTPSLAAFAAHPAELDATIAQARAGGYDPGDPWELSRATPSGETLRWRLTRAADHTAVLPFLIDWGTTSHPGEQELASLELVEFTAQAPDPAAVTRVLGLLGVDLPVIEGERAGLRAVLRGPAGEVVLTTA